MGLTIILKNDIIKEVMDKNAEIINQAIQGSLNVIDQEREREIISRRFGLKGKRETLEQIGEMLSITRERVRQLEKVILIHLSIVAEDGLISELAAAEKIIIRNLTEMGRIACVSDLGRKIYGRDITDSESACLAFIGHISTHLTLIDSNDRYYDAIGIADYGNTREVYKKIDEIVNVIKKNKDVMTLDQLDDALSYEHPDHIKAMASISKQLATLDGVWGLVKWPSVNPRNIRDKIFVVLNAKKEPMHFAEIAKIISESNFKRKNVTVQAIHNELIKDDRFILIGRGIYALSSWGYKKGTVADIIAQVLQESDKPLDRATVVKSVLKVRKVKESTVLLNLQNRKLFAKIGKDSYQLAQK